VPVLPIIDLLILLGWTSLMAGGVLKAIHLTTAYRPLFFSLRPIDFLIIAGVFMVFALALAARTWVKLNEPQLRLVVRRQALPSRGYDAGLPAPSPESPPDPDASNREQPGHVYGR
jgi:hypothetical protein